MLLANQENSTTFQLFFDWSSIMAGRPSFKGGLVGFTVAGGRGLRDSAIACSLFVCVVQEVV